MIGVTGAAEVLGNIAGIIARAAVMDRAIVDDVSNFVADTAREMVAVDTGETRDSITVTGDGVSVGGAAVYLEFGTYKMAAEPFFRPAADAAAQHDVSGIARTTLLGGV